VTPAELAALIADELDERDDIAEAIPAGEGAVEHATYGAEVAVTTQGGTELLVLVTARAGAPA
jgi:hypothetical protein